MTRRCEAGPSATTWSASRRSPVATAFGQDLLTIRRSGMLIHAEIAPHIDFITSDQGAADTPKLVPITSAAARDLVIETLLRRRPLLLFHRGCHPGRPIPHLRTPGCARCRCGPVCRCPAARFFGLRSADEAYAYRWTSFAASPAPELLLRYDTDKGFSAGRDLMKKPAPSAEKLQQMAGGHARRCRHGRVRPARRRQPICRPCWTSFTAAI